MTQATLHFRTDGGAEARRLIEELARACVEAQRAVESANRASVRRSARAAAEANADAVQSAKAAGLRIVRETASTEEQRGGAYRKSRVVAEREERLVTRAKLRELALQGEAQRKFTAQYGEAHRQATAMLEAEVGKRGQLSERERRQVEQLALAIVASHDQAERQRTAATAREDRKRRSIWGRRIEQAGRAVGTAIGAGGQVTGQAHDLIQDARERRAHVQHNVIEAVSQVGVSDLGEVNRYTNLAIDAGRRHGLRSQDLTGAIAQAQTEFSTLGGMEAARTPEGRASVFERAIATAVRGRNLGVDPGEFSRLMGMLGQRGLDSGSKEFLSAWVVGAAQRGAVEPGAITREAMAPIIQRMSSATSALGPGASTAQRSDAARRAFMQAFAEVQVLRSMGENVRAAAGNMANFERVLSNPGVMTRMQGNLGHIADRNVRQRVQATLFDHEGHLQPGLDNPARFVAAVMGAGLSDPRQMANVFAGTGAGNPMSLTAPIRRMALALASRDVEGRSGVERLNALQSSAVALSPARMEAMARLREGSDEANLVRNEEERLAALTTNTGAIDRLSNQFAAFEARNPLAAKVAPVVATAGAGLLGATGSLVLTGALAMDAQSRAVREGRTFDGRQLSPIERVSRLAGSALLGPIAAAVRTGADVYQAAQGPRGLDALLDALPERLARSLRENPPQITVPPNASVHEQSVATSGRQAGGA